MILFNLVLNQQMHVDSHKDLNTLNRLRDNIQDNLVSAEYASNYDRKIHSSILFLAKNNTKQVLNDNYLMHDKIGSQMFNKSFLGHFINKYWKETIFISLPDSSMQARIDQMRGNKLSLYSSEYKNLLLAFSKALINRRIKVLIRADQNLMYIQRNKFYFENKISEVIWKKGFNIVELKDIWTSIIWQIKLLLPNTKQIKAIKLVNNKPLPLFAVLNDFNQIILAEPSNKMLASNTFIDYIFQVYKKIIVSKHNINDKYLALFFINPKDAMEYSESIYQKYNSITSQSLKLFPTKLDLYYKLLNLNNRKTDFRLIPDLKEVNQLINKYQYYKNISFQAEQKYGRDFFQGQPIYRIKPIIAINKKSKQKFLLNYSYNILSNSKEVEYEAVFLNYNTALHAWLKFKKQMNNYNLPSKPKLDVYNLESFIKTFEPDKRFNQNKIIFIPSHESYRYIKSNIKLTSELNIFEKCVNKYVYIKVITQRILWSLTSRQPIKW